MRKVVQHSFVILAALMLAACPRDVRPPEQPPTTAPLPEAELRGAALYVINPQASEVHIFVYRGGTLARLGHNHVVTARSLTGRAWLHPMFGQSGFELSFPVERLLVDDPQARSAAGAEFEKDVSEADREGTRKNMLRPEVLDVQRHPDITLRTVRAAGTPQAARITARITIRDVSRDVEIPTTISVQGAQLTARGEFEIRQSDFGIKPFSVALGALVVQDEIHIRFKVIAEKQ